MSGFHHEIDRNKDFLALNVEPSSIHQIPGAPRSRQQEYAPSKQGVNDIPGFPQGIGVLGAGASGITIQQPPGVYYPLQTLGIKPKTSQQIAAIRLKNRRVGLYS